MRNNNVAFIGHGLYAGGAEKNLLYICSYLQEMGVGVDIINFKRVNEYEKQHEKIVKKLHINNLLRFDTKVSPLLRGPTSIFMAARLFVLLLRGQYRILISAVEYYPAYITVFFATILRKKSVLIVGDNIDRDLEKKGWLSKNLHRLFTGLAFAHANTVVCVSTGLAHAIRDTFHVPSNKIKIIHNGVDILSIQRNAKKNIPSARLKIFSKKHRIIITLGRLVEKKNHQLVIKSLKFLKKDIIYIIVGKGPLERSLKTLANSLKLENRVFFLGFEKENPYPYIAHSQLFVFPSRFEGFGNVVVEAMACGTPVMSTNCEYGPEEIVTKQALKYGILIGKKGEEVSPRRLAESINMFFNLDNKTKTQLSINSRKRAAYFTKEKMCRAYYKLVIEK